MASHDESGCFAHTPALSHDHEYLRFLRGESKDLGGTPDSSPARNNGTGAETPNHDTSFFDQELQAWLHAVKGRTETLQFDQPGGIRPELRISCGQCHQQIEPSSVFFCCVCCEGPNNSFYLCEKCASSKKLCDGAGHELRLVKSIRAELGQLVMGFADHMHSIPRDRKRESQTSESVDANLRDANLHAVLKAYTTGEFKDESPQQASLVPLETNMVSEWQAICNFMAYDQYRPSIRRSLTSEHIAVINLLLEWWTGEIQDYRLTQMTINSFIITALFPGTKRDDMATLSSATRSEYNSALLKLFYLEFIPKTPPASMLRLQRAEAAQKASVQRLGFSYLRGNMNALWQEPTANVDQIVRSRLASVANFMSRHLRVCKVQNARETSRFAIVTLKAWQEALYLSIENLRTAQQRLGTKQFSASISPCAWIPQAERLAVTPYYLWDKKERKTVRTQDLMYLPEYTVVSHTWGRWRNKKDPSIDFPNVPWKIPQNTRFRVQDLGNILHEVPESDRYVWFDLVCVPQSPDTDELKAIERHEIASQAAIFSRAATAVIWFNNMVTLDPLEDICHILAMNALRYPGQFDSEESFKRVSELFSRCQGLQAQGARTPLGKAGLEFIKDRSWTEALDEWFSSTWTLQEACIRPDMWLCNQTWEPLISSAVGAPIPLDCVLSLIRFNTQIVNLEVKSNIELTTVPEFFSGLKFCEQETRKNLTIIKSPPACLVTTIGYACTAGLIEIPGIERIRIISLGNQRHCEKKYRRAEAVMAVLGATDWFTKDADDPSSSRTLILGRYPIDFVVEVRRKLGDYDFFTSNIARDFWHQLKATTTVEEMETLKVRGTLLPFGEAESLRAIRITLENEPQIMMTQEEIYPGMAEWRIEANGSVTLAEASILISSSGTPPSNEILADIQDYHEITDMHQLSALRRTRENLIAWVSARPYTCHAIVLRRRIFGQGLSTQYHFTGLIFKELEPKVLIKTGIFGTPLMDNLPWPIPTRVNWTVL